jgi:hypothetical protein
LLDVKEDYRGVDWGQYDFTLDDKKEAVTGRKMLVEFDYNYKKRRKFKAQNREVVFASLESFMRGYFFEMVYRDEDLTMMTFVRRLSEEPDYVEIYVPDDFDHMVEMVAMYCYSDLPETPVEVLDLEATFFDRDLLASLRFDCEDEAYVYNEYGMKIKSFKEYLGLDTSRVGVESVKWPITESRAKWIKQKADKNCLSRDPNDCFVYCLVELPREFKTMTIVTDTSVTSRFTTTEIEAEVSVKKGHKKVVPVLCPDDLDEEVTSAIEAALESRGYSINASIGETMKAALVQFQKDNRLPVGKLDYETLSRL